MSSKKIGEERGFSVELNSKEYMKRFTILNGAEGRVLVEGVLGELQQITLVEGLMLEVKCSNGILRMDMTEDDLRRVLSVKIKASKEG
ncbi:MAG: hypothetical protein NTY03_09510 [Candidatus Bathyarchaeota archaeon]|jgi:hypothetical protein|nr:hypothetical protein [Candidatus Bathyarchaeota archaeon]